MSYVDSQLSLYLVSALMGAGTAIAGPIFYAKVVSGCTARTVVSLLDWC